MARDWHTQPAVPVLFMTAVVSLGLWGVLVCAFHLFHQGYRSFTLLCRARERFEGGCLIPTYNKDLDIIEATMIGCGKITYPHTTYALDNGNRPQLKAQAGRLGCQFITRPTH